MKKIEEEYIKASAKIIALEMLVEQLKRENEQLKKENEFLKELVKNKDKGGGIITIKLNMNKEKMEELKKLIAETSPHKSIPLPIELEQDETDDEIKKIKDAAFKIADKYGCRIDKVHVFYDIKVWLAHPEHPLPHEREELEKAIREEVSKITKKGFDIEVE
jgi:cytosine/adenosine deaminase-related metal-dependent hydrolase